MGLGFSSRVYRNRKTDWKYEKWFYHPITESSKCKETCMWNNPDLNGYNVEVTNNGWYSQKRGSKYLVLSKAVFD